MKVVFFALAALTVIIATAATTATIIQCRCPYCGRYFEVSTTAVQEQTPEQRQRDKAEAEKAIAERNKIQKDSFQDSIDQKKTNAARAYVKCACGRKMIYQGSSERKASTTLYITHEYTCQCGKSEQKVDHLGIPRIKNR